MWTVLTIIAAISLVAYWRGPNTVWGATTAGAVVGLIVAIVSYLLSNGFHWSTIGKGFVVGTILGLLMELPATLSGSAKEQKKDRH
jgi:hypothetical protein